MSGGDLSGAVGRQHWRITDGATENGGLSSSANPWSAAADVSWQGGLREGRGLGQTGLPARADRFDGTGAPLGHRQPPTELVPCDTSKTPEYPAGTSRSCSTGDHRDHRLQAPGAVTQSRGKAIRTEMPAPQPSASRPKNRKTSRPKPDAPEMTPIREIDRNSIGDRSGANRGRSARSGCLSLPR